MHLNPYPGAASGRLVGLVDTEIRQEKRAQKQAEQEAPRGAFKSY